MNYRTPIVAVGLAMLLSACSSNPETTRNLCMVGGGAAGLVAAAGSGPGAVGAGIAGVGIGAILCDLRADEPMVVAAATEMMDSDGDGVPDQDDRCSDTPAGSEVDSWGCALDMDADGDGVTDDVDACPNTPAGLEVDSRGCPVPDEVVLTINELNFAFDSAELDASSRAALDAAVSVIEDHSEVMLDVVGHTDTSGPAAYNQKLSEKRAQAAVDYLVSQGIPAGQLRAVGAGESDPVASNDTRAGRERNRRVELVVR